MTNSSHIFKNIHNYHGSLEIEIINESTLQITTIRDINQVFKNIFISLRLSGSLISVHQLVDNNCDRYFSRNSYLVQD